MMLIGVDPGYEKIGYAVFDVPVHDVRNPEFVTSGIIKTSKSLPHPKRIEKLAREFQSKLVQFKIETMVMEQLFFFKNAKTVIGVAQAQGALMYASSLQDVEVFFLTPLQIKSIITGDGRADKTAVHKMLSLTMGTHITVSDDDESDAIACAYAYCFSL